MNLLLSTAAVMALVSTVATGVAAQVGVKAAAISLRDSPPTSPLFTISPKNAVAGHGLAGTLQTADLPREQIGAIHCPMPVLVPDSTKQDWMPVSRPDTELAERVPVTRSGCTNRLWNKPRP
jgi:hypothetical protein